MQQQLENKHWKYIHTYKGRLDASKKVQYTANISNVLSTAFGSVTFATVIWLHILHSKIAIDFKLYYSLSLNIISTVVDCNNYCQITVAHVTKPMTANWL